MDRVTSIAHEAGRLTGALAVHGWRLLTFRANASVMPSDPLFARAIQAVLAVAFLLHAWTTSEFGIHTPFVILAVLVMLRFGSIGLGFGYGINYQALSAFCFVTILCMPLDLAARQVPYLPALVMLWQMAVFANLVKEEFLRHG